MPAICYIPRTFGKKSQDIIDQANAICRQYAQQGYDLTLRQLYYQFVSRDLIANKPSEYDRLGEIINAARLAGEMDWDFIIDRTRNIRARSHWETAADIVASAAASYHKDLWERQEGRVEVWIEKDALVGVIDDVCSRNDVPSFSCRGYTSQSEVWAAARRIEQYIDEGKEQITIIHLGDHDPSGIDMTRDIGDRLALFLDGDGYDPDALTIERIALNYDQVQAYRPPPNPAKLTDSRATGYIARHGDQSWELDALAPNVIAALVEDTIRAHRDDALWKEDIAALESERTVLTRISDQYDRVVSALA
jgi:hypothetical protein